MYFLSSLIGIIYKEWQLQRGGVFLLLRASMLIIPCIYVIGFISTTNENSSFTIITLGWFLTLFTILLLSDHTFEYEKVYKTWSLLCFYAHPLAIFTAKTIFNNLLSIMTTLLIWLSLWLFLPVHIKHPNLFISTLLLSTMCISTASTLINSLTILAKYRYTSLTFIGIPILIPALWLSIQLSLQAITSIDSQWVKPILGLAAYNGLFICLLVLFYNHLTQN